MADNAVPEPFLTDVKEALENLYDFAFLNRHPLAASSPAGGRAEAAGHRLRRELIEAVESLKAPSASPNAGRTYHLLNLHYVAGMSLPEAASSLGVSVRQAYRDLRQGLETVAYLLWYRRQTAAPALPADAPTEPLVPTNLIGLIETAIRAVSRLADGHGVTVQARLPEGSLIIASDQAAAQQVCIHLLSQTVQAAAPGPIAVALVEEGAAPLLDLSYSPREPAVPVPIGAAVQGFIERLGWQVTQAVGQVRLRFTPRRAVLLVIDDQAGLSELIQRYAADRSLEVLAASDAMTGLSLAREMRPGAILLDLMMPGMDGWELLQRLRTSPDTADLPVVICSVINDPELAYSLGASYFLAKPITRESLMAALAQIGV